MANFFDQFDTPAAKKPNFFDQFDEEAPPPPPARVVPPPAAAPNPDLADLPVPGSKLNLQQPQTLEEQIMGGLGYGADTASIVLENLRKGAANLLGLPVDLLNMGMGAAGVPVSDNPIGGSDSIDALLTGFGLVPKAPAPKDILQNVVGRMAQEVGAASVPMAGTLGRAAGQTLQEIRQSRTVGDQLGRFMGSEKAAADPLKYIGDETITSLGAGTGAGVLNTFTGNGDQHDAGIDTTGAVGGALITGAAGNIFGGVRNIAAGLTGNPNFAANVVRDNVVDTIIQNSDVMGRQVNPADLKAPLDTSALIDAIMRGQDNQVDDLIDGYYMSTADRSGDTGLAMLENARARNNPGPYRARMDANTQAVEETVQGLKPTQQPGAYNEVAEAERGNRIAAATANANDAQAAFDDALRALTPTSPNETARGSNIRAALEDAQTAATNLERQAWEAAATDEPVEINSLADAFKAVDDSLTDVERQKYRPAEADIPASRIKREQPRAEDGSIRGDLDPEDQRIFDAIMGTGGDAASGPVQVSAREVTSLRSALTTDIRKATSGLEPDENKARILGRYVDAIDNYINATPALAGRFEQARAVSRDVNDRFNRAQTGIAQSLSRNGGVYQLDDSAVPRKFVQPDSGRINDYQALMREAGNDQRARQAVSDQLIADARSSGVLDNPAALRQFLDERQVVLGDFPALRDQLERAGRSRAAADQAAASRDETVSTLTAPGKSTVANYLRYGTENSDKAIRTVLNAKDPKRAADELLSFVGDKPDAVEGVRSAFWRELENKGRTKNAAAETASGTMPLVPRKVSEFLDDPAVAAVAERLYRDNPEHLQNIKKIFTALRSVNSGQKVGNAVNPSGTGLLLKGQPPVTMAEIGSKAYQVQIGRGSLLYALTYIGGKFARNLVGGQQSKAYELLLDKALLDPELAATLLKDNNPANRAALAQKAKLWLGNQTSNLINAMSASEQDDNDPVNAAMKKD